MKRLWLFWILVGIPFLLMIMVNVSASTPSDQFDNKRCTRYCHNYGCLHTQEKYATTSSWLTKASIRLYSANIAWLKKNGLGLSYEQMNLLVYVLLAPLFLSLLLWGTIRKKTHGNVYH